MHNLSLHLTDCVCDFIKDDHGNWYFINLKGFKISLESKARVKIWHAINILHRPEDEVVKNRQLTKQERFLKHEAELGVVCRLCGLYYIENAVIDSAKIYGEKLYRRMNKQTLNNPDAALYNNERNIALGTTVTNTIVRGEAATTLAAINAGLSLTGSLTLNDVQHAALEVPPMSIEEAQKQVLQEQIKIAEIPAYGYTITTAAATLIVSIYQIF
jgi:hypothetical protein